MASSQHEFKPLSQGVLSDHGFESKWVAISDSLIANILLDYNSVLIMDIDQHTICHRIEHKKVTALSADPKRKCLITASMDKILVHQIDEEKKSVKEIVSLSLPFGDGEEDVDVDFSSGHVRDIQFFPDGVHFIGAYSDDSSIPNGIFIAHKKRGIVDNIAWDTVVQGIQIIPFGNIYKLVTRGHDAVYAVDINTANKKIFGKPQKLSKEDIDHSLSECLVLSNTMTCVLQKTTRPKKKLESGIFQMRVSMKSLQKDFSFEEKDVIQIDCDNSFSPMQVFSDGSVLLSGLKTLERASDVRAGVMQSIVSHANKIKCFCIMADQRIVIIDDKQQYLVFPRPKRIALYEDFVTELLSALEIKNRLNFSVDTACIISSYAFETGFFKQRKNFAVDTEISSVRAILISGLGKLVAELKEDQHPDNAVLKLLQKNLLEPESQNLAGILSASLDLQASQALNKMMEEVQQVFAPVLIPRHCERSEAIQCFSF